MALDVDLLLTWGATIKEYKKKVIIFKEDNPALHYYQIISGKVAMYNIDDDGKEFYQGMFCEQESFGEPPLFINECYPSSAIAIKDSVIIKLTKVNFFEMLHSTPSLQNYFVKLFATRIFDKANAARTLIINNAEARLLDFLNNIKKKQHITSDKIFIIQTRQEIANITGLRVETVIRTLAKLQEQKKVQIIDHKLYY